MTIWLTRPFNYKEAAINDRLIKRWDSVVPDATWITAESYESHGQLLTRIWAAILDSDEPVHLITEMDMIPYAGFQLEALTLLSQSPALFTEYVTRNPDLTLNRWGPLSGGWLIGFNRDLKAPDLPLNWLDAGSKFNDAANLAYQTYPDDPDVILEEGRDEAPNSLCIEYEGLGSHMFFSRHYADDPAIELFPSYTLGRHLADINSRLDALEA